MRSAISWYRKSLKPRIAPLHGESGASSLEWLGLSAAVLVLAGAIVLSLQANSGGPIPAAIEKLVASHIRSLVTGDGGENAPAPGVSSPGIKEPGVNEPGITAHATGLASFLARSTTAPGDRDGGAGGGSWSNGLIHLVTDPLFVALAVPVVFLLAQTVGKGLARGGPMMIEDFAVGSDAAVYAMPMALIMNLGGPSQAVMSVVLTSGCFLLYMVLLKIDQVWKPRTENPIRQGFWLLGVSNFLGLAALFVVVRVLANA